MARDNELDLDSPEGRDQSTRDEWAGSTAPGDLGSMDTGSGLTAGGTGTALPEGPDTGGGTPLSSGSVTGGISSGEIGTEGTGIPGKRAEKDERENA